MGGYGYLTEAGPLFALSQPIRPCNRGAGGVVRSNGKYPDCCISIYGNSPIFARIDFTAPCCRGVAVGSEIQCCIRRSRQADRATPAYSLTFGDLPVGQLGGSWSGYCNGRCAALGAVYC